VVELGHGGQGGGSGRRGRRVVSVWAGLGALGQVEVVVQGVAAGARRRRGAAEVVQVGPLPRLVPWEHRVREREREREGERERGGRDRDETDPLSDDYKTKCDRNRELI